MWMYCRSWMKGFTAASVDQGSSVLRFLAKRAGWGFPGSTIVLEVLPKDLSPASLMRIVEADGAQITSFNVALPVEDSEFLEVTFKVNTEEIESLLSTLRRHEFVVQSFYNAPGGWRTRCGPSFEAFMRYSWNRESMRTRSSSEKPLASQRCGGVANARHGAHR